MALVQGLLHCPGPTKSLYPYVPADAQAERGSTTQDPGGEIPH